MDNNECLGGAESFGDAVPDWNTSGDVLESWAEYAEKSLGIYNYYYVSLSNQFNRYHK